MSSALSLFVPFFFKKKEYDLLVLYGKRFYFCTRFARETKCFLEILIKRLRGLTYAVLLLKKNFSESLEVKLKSLYLCSPVRKKGSFFV